MISELRFTGTGVGLLWGVGGMISGAAGGGGVDGGDTDGSTNLGIGGVT